MYKLNILLVGDLNPELDNFLREVDSETRLIRRMYWAPDPGGNVIEQIRKNDINAIILDPLTGDPFQPVSREAIDLISEVRREFPGRVAFVLYTDWSEAEALLAQHSDSDFANFIHVDAAPEEARFFFENLRLALKKCKAYLSPEQQDTSLTLRVCLLSLLVVLYLVAIYVVQDWAWLQSHSNRLGLYLCTAIIVISVCLALWKREWQASALTVGALGALLVIAQIIDR